MSTAVGSSTKVHAAVARPKPVNLDAEKAKYERQLADWVHCVSATTSAGKAKIAELSAKLSAIDTQIKKADDDGPQPNKAAAAAPADPTASAPSTAPAASASLGTVVDVYV